MLKYPVLAIFLLVVRPTHVLELRYRGMKEKREMRWTRSSKEDEFVGECWTIG
jgi:hypothetical protein